MEVLVEKMVNNGLFEYTTEGAKKHWCVTIFSINNSSDFVVLVYIKALKRYNNNCDFYCTLKHYFIPNKEHGYWLGLW